MPFLYFDNMDTVVAVGGILGGQGTDEDVLEINRRVCSESKIIEF
jgi:hypothetical protein